MTNILFYAGLAIFSLSLTSISFLLLHGKSENTESLGRIGKTYRLAYEYIRSVIDSPQLYRHILAVTFTNKATEEMKQRIVGELNALANGSPSGYMGDLERDLGLDGQTIRRRAADARTKILHDYSRFTVLTIDKFSSGSSARSSRNSGSI